MNKNIFWIYILGAITYFSQGLSSLPSSAFFFYLKEDLNLNEQKIMWISSLIGLAWLVKPLWGILIDSGKYNKRQWMMLSILCSIIFTIFIGFNSWLPLIIVGMILFSWSGAIRDVAIDGLMCTVGKKFEITGQIQSLQWGALTFASVLTGLAGGWLADHTTYQNCYFLLIPFYIFMLYVAYIYSDNNIKTTNINWFKGLKEIITDKTLLLVCLFIFLYNFAPSIGTPLAFIQRDEFHWSKTFMGLLSTISAIGAIVGAGLYWKFSKTLNVKKWLYGSVFFGASSTLCYLFYTPVTAVLYDTVFSISGMFVTLLLLDLMARESKHGLEAITFALLCSVSNLTGTVNSFIGGLLLPIVGLKFLIIISASTSFLCLPLIKRLKI